MSAPGEDGTHPLGCDCGCTCGMPDLALFGLHTILALARRWWMTWRVS